MQNETKDEKGWFIIKYFVMVPLLLLALFMMASCGEDKKEEVKSPEVEVERGELPEYDVERPNVEIRVDTPDVNVKTPDVDVEAEVDIPSVEVEVRD